MDTIEKIVADLSSSDEDLVQESIQVFIAYSQRESVLQYYFGSNSCSMHSILLSFNSMKSKEILKCKSLF